MKKNDWIPAYAGMTGNKFFVMFFNFAKVSTN